MTETNNTRAVKIALVIAVDIKGAWHPPRLSVGAADCPW